MVPPAVLGRPDITATSHAGGDYRSQQGRHFSGRETVSGPSVVADNTLIIKQKSTLPVSKPRQDKSLFRSLSDIYLPPVERTKCVVLVGRGSIGLLSGQRRVSPDQRLRKTQVAFSPISVMTSWHIWAAMAGGHNRQGATRGVGHARRSWNAVRDDHSRPSLTGNAARALPFPTSQRPTCPFSFTPGGSCQALCGIRCFQV